MPSLLFRARYTPLAHAALLLVLALPLQGALAQTGAPAQTQRFDMAAQPLAAALDQFARQAGLQLVFAPELAAGRQAPALHGQLPLREALDSLLKNSGLHGRMQDGTLTVETAPTRESTLAEVRVTASAERSAITEGSGSYKADAVTIGKTTQSLKEIPQSVSVLTQTQMQDQGVTTVAQAMATMAGVRTDSYEGQERLTVRGYSLGAQFDGVPQMSSLLYLHNDLALYDRVEVLRGPSGMLQGSGSPAGSVNYVRKRPKDVAGINVAFGAGSWNHYRAEVDATGPLNEDGSLRGRLVVAQRDQDSFYDVGHVKNTVAYGMLEYDLTPQTKLGLALTHLDVERVNFFGLPTMADGSLIPSRKAFVGASDPAKQKVNEVVLDGSHQFGNGWTAKGTLTRKSLAYTGYGAYSWSGIDPSNGGLVGVSLGRIQTDDVWTGIDASISGPFELLGRTHNLTLGYNRVSDDYKGNSNYVSIAQWDVLNQHDFGALLPGRGATTNNDDIVESGFYGVGRFKLTDPLTLVLGGRWTNYQSRSRSIAATTSDWSENSRVRYEFTPYGGLVWNLTPAVTWYASYVDIFAPQTNKNYEGKLLDPRVGWQIETGIKSSFLDDRLSLSLAAFRIGEKNRSMTDPDPTHICADAWDGSCTMAAGLVQTQGWEAEVVGRPAAGWDISASYTYVDAKYLRDSAKAGSRFAPDVTPRHMFKLWSHHRFSDQSALAGWDAGFGLQSQSDLYIDNGSRQPGYTTLSASLGYRINPHWSTQLVVNNLTDRTYLQSLGGRTFHNMYGAPRNAMLTLRGAF